MLPVIEACDALPWRELRTELHRFVGARVAPSDVDDVVQDALASIHRGAASLRDRERFAPWMYRVTRNAIVDHHRRRRPVAALPEEPVADPGDDDDEALAEMLAHCMRAFVAMLPPVYRQAITLVELEGRTQVDAAERLGVSVSTMKSRVQRGRARLRELIEACCVISLDVRGRVIDATPRGPACTGACA